MEITNAEHVDSEKSKDFSRRIITALWGIPVLVGSLSIGGWVLSAVVLILSCIACWEYRGLVIRKGGDPSTLGLFGGVLLLYFVQRLGAFQAGLAILILGNLILAASRYKKGSTLSNAAYAMLGALYVSLFNYLLSLRQLPTPGGNYALYAIFLTWATDISAYFIGIRWGKTPLAQALSPKKSREGAVAGLVGSALAGVCFGGFWFQWHWLRGALVGLVVGFSAQAGDLCESALKRDAGVKDAGHILPGHGGILDRFDSILFVAPVLYFLIQLFF